MTKFYIVRYLYGKERSKKEYYQKKCLEVWTTNKTICWQFTKQGALKIIEKLKEDYINNTKVLFELEEVVQNVQH